MTIPTDIRNMFDHFKATIRWSPWKGSEFWTSQGPWEPGSPACFITVPGVPEFGPVRKNWSAISFHGLKHPLNVFIPIAMQQWMTIFSPSHLTWLTWLTWQLEKPSSFGRRPTPFGVWDPDPPETHWTNRPRLMNDVSPDRAPWRHGRLGVQQHTETGLMRDRLYGVSWCWAHEAPAWSNSDLLICLRWYFWGSLATFGNWKPRTPWF